MTARKPTAKERTKRQRFYSYWADGLPLLAARLELADSGTLASQQGVRDALVQIGRAATAILPHFKMPTFIPADPATLLHMPRLADQILDRWAIWARFDPATNALLDKLYAGSLCAFGYEHPRLTDAAPALIPSQLFIPTNVVADEGKVAGEGYSFFDVRVVNRTVEAVLFDGEDQSSPPAGARSLFMRLFADLSDRGDLPPEVTTGIAFRLKSLCLQRFPFYESEIRRITPKTLGTYLTAFRRSNAARQIECDSGIPESQ